MFLSTLRVFESSTFSFILSHSELTYELFQRRPAGAKLAVVFLQGRELSVLPSLQCLDLDIPLGALGFEVSGLFSMLSASFLTTNVQIARSKRRDEWMHTLRSQRYRPDYSRFRITLLSLRSARRGSPAYLKTDSGVKRKTL